MASPETTPQRQLLTITEAARLLNVSRTTTYRLIHRADLPAVKVGGQLRIDRDELHTYIYQEKSL